MTDASERPTPCNPDRSHDPALWDRTRRLYQESLRNGAKEFSIEEPILEEALAAICSSSAARYAVEDVIGVGASGVVYLVCDRHLGARRALKLARPLGGKPDVTIEIVTREIGRLVELAHANVTPIYDQGSVPVSELDLPFYVMAYVQDGQDSRRYFSVPRRLVELLSLIRSVVRGVKHLHDRQALHLDLKPSNFLIAPDSTAYIGDLGSARKRAGDPMDVLEVACTERYAHPDLLKHLQTPTETKRRRGSLTRSQLEYRFDLFALGKSLSELVHQFDEVSHSELDSYTRKYLLLLAARLLDGLNHEDPDHPEANECVLGLPSTAFRQLRYTSIDEVDVDVDKLLGTFRIDLVIPELSRSAASYIQVSDIGRPPFTDRLAALLKEPLLRRLGETSQLGLLNLVYPTATHTRLEHALGTYTNICEYIYYLYHDPINPLFRQIMSEEDLSATLLAAILHDLGQYPLAHDLEDAHRPLFSHSFLTASLLKGERVDLQPLSQFLQHRIEHQWHTTWQRVLSILEAKTDDYGASVKDRILHSLIDGPIDADKLDYLVRDGKNCKVPYAEVIDWDRLLRTLTVVYQKEGGSLWASLGIHEKGRVAAECVAFARYAMFSQVYWHHTARACKAMLHRVVWEWLETIVPDWEPKRTEFHMFLLWQGLPAAKQTSLFQEQQDNKQALSESQPVSWSQVNRGDREVLLWLYARTTEAGRRIIEELLGRRLYKRVAVISNRHNVGLWTKLQKVAQRDIPTRLSFARQFQSMLRKKAEDSVRAAREEGRSLATTGVTSDMVDEALRSLAQEATVLVDIPVSRDDFAEDLRYFSEVQHRHQLGDFVEPAKLDDSAVWHLLAAQLHSLAGKVRIFIHPDAELLQKTVLRQNAIEKCLNDACATVLG